MDEHTSMPGSMVHNFFSVQLPACSKRASVYTCWYIYAGNGGALIYISATISEASQMQFSPAPTSICFLFVSLSKNQCLVVQCTVGV